MDMTPDFQIPVIRSHSLALGANEEIFYCDVTQGPTGSWKDLIAQRAVEQAVEGGFKGIAVATSGNHGRAILFAANRFGFPVKVLSYFDTPAEVVQDLLGLGADVMQFSGRDSVYAALSDLIEKGWFSATLLDSQRGGMVSPGAENYSKISDAIILHKSRQNCKKLTPLILVPTSYGDGASSIKASYRDATGGHALICLVRAGNDALAIAPSIATSHVTPEVATLIGDECLSFRCAAGDILAGQGVIERELNLALDKAVGGIPSVLVRLREFGVLENRLAYCVITGRHWS